MRRGRTGLWGKGLLWSRPDHPLGGDACPPSPPPPIRQDVCAAPPPPHPPAFLLRQGRAPPPPSPLRSRGVAVWPLHLRGNGGGGVSEFGRFDPHWTAADGSARPVRAPAGARARLHMRVQYKAHTRRMRSCGGSSYGDKARARHEGPLDTAHDRTGGDVLAPGNRAVLWFLWSLGRLWRRWPPTPTPDKCCAALDPMPAFATADSARVVHPRPLFVKKHGFQQGRNIFEL